MPSEAEWKSRLSRAVDPLGAVSDTGIHQAQVRILLNDQTRQWDHISRDVIVQAENMIKALAAQCAQGVLDTIFLAPQEDQDSQLAEAVDRLNDAVAGRAQTVAFAQQGGGFKPLVEKLVAYVRKHPFAEPQPPASSS